MLSRWRWAALAEPYRLFMLWSTALIVVLAPCLYANGDDAFSGPLILLSAVQLAIVGVGIAISQKVPRSVPLALAAVLLLWYTLSAAFSIAPYHSARVLAVWAGAIGIFYGLLAAQPNPREIRRVSLFLVTGVAGLCLYGLFMAFQNGYGFRHAFSVTFSNSDCFGALVLMALMLGAGLLPLSSAVQNHLLLVDLMILFASLVGTGSRAGLIGALVAGAIIAARRLRARGVSLQRTFTVMVLGAALAVVCAFLIDGDELGSRFQETFSKDGQQGWSVRSIVLRGFPRTVARAPLLGSGPGTFHLAFQPDRPYGLFNGYINQAHVDLIQIVVEGGVVGLALFGTLLGLALVRGWRSRAAPSVIGPVAALLGVTAYGLVNFAVPVPADLFWIFALLGITFAYVSSTKHVDPLVPEPGPHDYCFTHVLAVVVPLVLLVSAASAWHLGRNTMLGLAAETEADALVKSKDWLQAVQGYTRAIALEPMAETHYHRRGLLLAQMGQTLGSWSMVCSGRNDLYTALRLNPRAKGVRIHLALLLERWGDVTTAEQILKDATQVYPQDPSPWQELAHLAALRDDVGAAAEDLWQAVHNDHDQVATLGYVLVALESERAGAGVQALKGFAAEGPDQTDWAVEAATYGVQRPANRLDAALAIIQEAVAIDPQRPATRLTMAAIEMKMGKTKGALTAIREASELSGQKVSAGVHRVVVDAGDNHPKEAIDLLRTYLATSPNDNLNRTTLATIYIRMQRPDKAIEAYKAALEVDPQDATLYANQAALFMQQGDVRTARNLLVEATRLDPLNDSYRKRLSNVEHHNLHNLYQSSAVPQQPGPATPQPDSAPPQP